MCVQSALTAKDFIPTLGALLIALLTYRGIFIKVRMDKKVKWIEDFRNEVARFSSHLPVFDSLTQEDERTMIYSTTVLRLYLNPAKSKHHKLYKEIDNIMSLLLNKEIANNLKVDSLREGFVKVLNISTEIIGEEQP